MGWEVTEIRIDLECREIQWSYEKTRQFLTVLDMKSFNEFHIIGALHCLKLILMVDLAAETLTTTKRSGSN